MTPPVRLVLIAALALVQCDRGPLQVEPSDEVGCDGQPYLTIDTTPYVLPYPDGASYRMPLGNCSVTFHGPDRPDRYAYDFAMPIGTPVTAARAGRVVYVEERGEDARPRVRGAAREAGLNNLVVVAHENGTFAQYMHLTLDGADVEVGDEVEPGDAIGRSGATGLAGYPHLHFVVTRDGYDFPYRSVPVTFSNASPADLVLREGEVYEAMP